MNWKEMKGKEKKQKQKQQAASQPAIHLPIQNPVHSSQYIYLNKESIPQEDNLHN